MSETSLLEERRQEHLREKANLTGTDSPREKNRRLTKKLDILNGIWELQKELTPHMTPEQRRETLGFKSIIKACDISNKSNEDSNLIDIAPVSTPPLPNTSSEQGNLIEDINIEQSENMEQSMPNVKVVTSFMEKRNPISFLKEDKSSQVNTNVITNKTKEKLAKQRFDQLKRRNDVKMEKKRAETQLKKIVEAAPTINRALPHAHMKIAQNGDKRMTFKNAIISKPAIHITTSKKFNFKKATPQTKRPSFRI